jgi:hypothetical protein
MAGSKMIKHPYQFSLRGLLIVITVLAVTTAMLAHHSNIMFGVSSFALWAMGLGYCLTWWFSPLRDLRPLKTTASIRRAELSAGTDAQPEISALAPDARPSDSRGNPQ